MIKQAIEAISNLNQVLNQLGTCKSTLDQQAVLVQEQIQSNLSIQVDALLQRENWLMKQVEIFKTDKLESVKREEDFIQGTINAIEGCMSDVDATENQLKDLLDKTRNVNVGSEPSPFMAFRSDAALLREVISQYGKIVGQYSGHFADPARPSLSLPRMVEEEDEVGMRGSTQSTATSRSAQLSHKAIGCLNSSRGDNTVIRIPRHAANSGIVQAWLHMSSSPPPVSTGIPGEPIKPNTKLTTLKPSETSSDSFEIVPAGSSDTTIRNWLTDYTVDHHLDDQMQQCQTKEDWNRIWSIGPVVGYKENNLTTPSVDQTKNNHLLGPMKHVIKSSNSDWLCIPKQTLPPHCLDGEKELDHMDLVSQVCVNGQCKGFQQCCQPNNCCNKLLDNKTPGWNQWLLDNNVIRQEQLLTQDKDACTANTDANLLHFDEIRRQPRHFWLLEQSTECAADEEAINEKTDPDINADKAFQSKESLKRWLNSSSKDTEKCCLDMEKKARLQITAADAEDENGWVRTEFAADEPAAVWSHADNAAYTEPISKWVLASEKLNWLSVSDQMVESANKSLENMNLNRIECTAEPCCKQQQDCGNKWLLRG